MRRVVVTGLGAISPLGVGVQRTWTRLLAGESGIASVAHFEPQAQWRSLPCTVAGVVPKGEDGGEGEKEGKWRAADWLSAADQRRMSTFSQYAVAATEMALRDAGWNPGPEREAERKRTGVFLGTGMSYLEDVCDTAVAHEQAGRRKVSPLFVPRALPNLAAGHVSVAHGFRGPNQTVMTACASGNHAIGNAAWLVASGKADVMVAGGAESCLHPLAFAGFCAARSLSTSYNAAPTTSCRPFDRSRDGFVLAEGAAVLVLETLGHARARGATPLAELRGYGLTGDAFHMTAPRPDGSGALDAMDMALREAQIPPRDVDYVNAHATATQVGDAAEVAAIRALMLGGDGGVDAEKDVTVSSTKGATGHLLGAAGAIEAVFSVLAIKENIVPPTLNLHSPDVNARFNFVPLKAQEKKVDVALTNSFGFGGVNASLVFSKVVD